MSAWPGLDRHCTQTERAGLAKEGLVLVLVPSPNLALTLVATRMLPAAGPHSCTAVPSCMAAAADQSDRPDTRPCAAAAAPAGSGAGSCRRSSRTMSGLAAAHADGCSSLRPLPLPGPPLADAVQSAVTSPMGAVLSSCSSACTSCATTAARAGALLLLQLRLLPPGGAAAAAAAPTGTTSSRATAAAVAAVASVWDKARASCSAAPGRVPVTVTLRLMRSTAGGWVGGWVAHRGASSSHQLGGWVNVCASVFLTMHACLLRVGRPAGT